MDSDRADNFLGKFWDPTQSWDPCPGLLEGLATDQPVLRLITALPDAPVGWEVDHQYPVLCGRGSTGELTILKCHSLGRFPTQEGQNLWCQRVLTGAALAPQNLAFASATVEISHLQEWAASLTPKPPTADQAIFSNTAAAAALPGASVELITGGVTSWDARGLHPRTFAQMRLAFEKPEPLDRVDLHLQCLLNMITFLTARPNYFNRVSLTTPAAEIPLEMSGRSSRYRIGADAPVHHWSGMLLPTHQESFIFAEFVPAWFALQATLGRAADWIFQSYYDEDAAAEERFLHVAQGLEAGYDQITATSRPLEQRYRAILDVVSDFSGQLVPNVEAFVQRSVEVRNYCTHWAEPRKEIKPPDLNELVSLTARLQVIFEAYLLVQLGISASEVRLMSAHRGAYLRAADRGDLAY